MKRWSFNTDFAVLKSKRSALQHLCKLLDHKRLNFIKNKSTITKSINKASISKNKLLSDWDNRQNFKILLVVEENIGHFSLKRLNLEGGININISNLFYLFSIYLSLTNFISTYD